MPVAGDADGSDSRKLRRKLKTGQDLRGDPTGIDRSLPPPRLPGLAIDVPPRVLDKGSAEGRIAGRPKAQPGEVPQERLDVGFRRELAQSTAGQRRGC
jgi:hypothetical protein